MSHSCDPKDCSPPGSFVLEWVAISLLQGIFLTQGLNLSFFRLLHRQVDSLLLSHWGSPAQALTIAFMHSCMLSHSVVSNSLQPHKDNPLSMGFSRQEYWSGLPFPSPRDLPNPGIKPECPAWQAGSLPLCYLGSPIAFMCVCSVPLCNRMDYDPPGSSVHGILQARILEWVAMPSSMGSSQPRGQTQVSLIAGRFFTI